VQAAGHMLVLSSELIGAVLEAAPDAMLIVDRAGTVRYANRHVTELFGHEHDRIVGHSVEALMPERFRAVHARHRDNYRSNPWPRPMDAGLELFGLRADGSEFPVEISLSPVECKPESFVVAAIRDMTNHFRVERQLQEAREHAERANHAKSRFLAAASHDLRQPLQSLSLLAGTLRRLAAGPEALEAVGSLELALGSMSRLLNALLDVSKLEFGNVKPDIRDFPIAALFRELHTEFLAAAHSKGLDLIVDCADESARSDPLLIGQILRNLVANAIRYTQKGVVTLRSRLEDGGVRIEVRDTGIGIPQDQLPYIYDEFYQVGVDTHASRQGYGLGLSIVQRLIRLLQLRLEVTSTIGAGSAFAFVLPQGRPAAEAAASCAPIKLSPCGAATPRHHLLLIEDDAAVLNATRLLLRTEGYRVTAALSAEEAVQRAAEFRDVDVIVSDFHLGNGKNGADAIVSLRSILGHPAKAILITGDTTSAIGDHLLDASMRLVQKPVTADELLATLRELLNS